MTKKPSEMTREELKEHITGILVRYQETCAKKRALGICVGIDCEKPALKDQTNYFFGDDHCEECAREAEVEVLEMEQHDEEEEEESDEDYQKRTGEPRGAGADWAGRTRGDFSE